MFAVIPFNGLLLHSMQAVQIGKADIVASAVIGLIVISWAVFALMCRYK